MKRFTKMSLSTLLYFYSTLDFSQTNVNNGQIKDFFQKIDKFSALLSDMSKCQ